MKCPACTSEMTEKDFGGVKVDVCASGCKGIWFDWVELCKLDESNEGFGQALKDALKNPRSNDEGRGQLGCPKCDAVMHIHKYQHAKEVNVDECPRCAGFFLDSGELKEVRDNYMSEEERKAYAQKLIQGVPELGQAQMQLTQRAARTEAIDRFTKFLRVSYYVTGK